MQDRFKVSETLLGIETGVVIESTGAFTRFKVSETLLGIETVTRGNSLHERLLIQSLRNPFRD